MRETEEPDTCGPGSRRPLRETEEPDNCDPVEGGPCGRQRSRRYDRAEGGRAYATAIAKKLCPRLSDGGAISSRWDLPQLLGPAFPQLVVAGELFLGGVLQRSREIDAAR